ncbi:hypothetical protein DXN05_03070 [Deminuibacter soli]|uniref:Glycosyltransferase RgtA/B/C/D-like domain-containing protein n=1 Tax=Deminuibacter soli TaxID=2291815 RepID=A0A3E1NPY1_9BACT|nr:hypothetical protein DXN05_03070 [Deminuibacter soli]
MVVTLAQWIIFKLLYPYADFFSDSYSYIEAAASHATVSIWPIGYSWFLSLLHQVHYSDTFVTSVQYFFLICSALVFFFTLLYFYQPAQNTIRFIWVFFFCNPLLLYLSNYISSDSLFTALSLLWFTQLLWIIQRPVWYQTITQALLLLIAFCVRYNAMYYPLITAVALFASALPKVIKWGALVFSVLLLALFVNYTGAEAKRLTGTRQFSVFSGWQLANNALYAYPHVKVPYHIFEGKASLFNRKVVKPFFDTCHPGIKDISPMNGAFYIRMPYAPLKQYYIKYVHDSTPATDFQAWGGVSPVFASFGSTFIKNYPGAYIQHYILPNSVNYMLPPLEKLEVYNLGLPQVYSEARYWFHYKSDNVHAVSAGLQGVLLFIFPPLFLVLNGAFIFCLTGFIKKRKLIPHTLWLCIVLTMVLFAANASFSILASPIVFRYQVFTMIVIFAFSAILSDLADSRQTKTAAG